MGLKKGPETDKNQLPPDPEGEICVDPLGEFLQEVRTFFGRFGLKRRAQEGTHTEPKDTNKEVAEYLNTPPPIVPSTTNITGLSKDK